LQQRPSGATDDCPRNADSAKARCDGQQRAEGAPTLQPPRNPRAHYKYDARMMNRAAAETDRPKG
jgi:hypothetical protein